MNKPVAPEENAVQEIENQKTLEKIEEDRSFQKLQVSINGHSVKVPNKKDLTSAQKEVKD